MTTYLKRPRHRGGVTNRQVLAFVWKYWMRRKYLFACACLLTGVWTGLDLFLPLASSRLIAAVATQPHKAETAWGAWRIFIALFTGYVVVRNVAFRIWSFISARNMEAITNEVFASVQAATTDWHTNQSGGETIRRVVRAMWGYDAITDAFVIWFGPAFIVLFGLSSMICWRQPLAGIISLTTIAIFVALNFYLTYRHIQPANQQSNRLDAALSGMLNDVLASNTTVKSFAAEAREAARIAKATAAWRRAITTTWRRFIDLGLLQNLSLLILLAGISGAMLRAWSRAEAGPGDIAFSITAFMLMSGYLKNIGDNIRMLQRGIDDMADAVALRVIETEPMPMRADEPASPLAGDICFDGVLFRYPGATDATVNSLSLQIRSGETVAILGRSGAGKSTLVKLLQRLYRPQDGRILLDGRDIAALPLDQLRRTFAVVPQNPELFHRTVLDNIAYARPDATSEEVRAAAQAACAHEFIMQLPQGYDTMVGERGTKLSGGQRQRLALARALLADAPVLILDEFTSALDPDTERKVLDAIRAHIVGRTCIVVTHRLSTAQMADRALEFDGGKMRNLHPGFIADTAPDHAENRGLVHSGR